MATLLSDDELLIRVRDGQLEFYEILIRRYNPRLFRLVYPILGNRSEAEDVIQETHLRALTHLHQFAGRSKFATWLGRIGIYEALGRLRSGKRFESTDGPSDHAWDSSPAPDPEQQAVRTELGGVLLSSIRGLPLALETCRRLQLTEETVKTRLHRAKAMLRRELQCRLRYVPAA